MKLNSASKKILAAVILLTLSMGCGMLTNIPLDNHGVNEGKAAPDFTFQNADGDWVSLSDFRGKKVFLFSWSTWCRCKYQLPALEEFYLEHKSDDFEIVAVASDSQGFKWVSHYTERANVTFTVLIDPYNSLGDLYNFFATENGWLIDEAGSIRMNQINFDIRNEEQRSVLLEAMSRIPDKKYQPPEKAPLDTRIADQQKKVADSPLCTQARFDLADLLRQKPDLSAAEKTLRDAIKLDPTSAEARWRLGVVLLEQGKPDDALASWQSARRFAPTNYLYLRNVQAFTDPNRFYSELGEDCGCGE